MKHILCFGDSNTYGYKPDGTGRFDYECRWTGLLDMKMSHQNTRIVENGLVGRTTVFDDLYRSGRNGSKLLPLSLEIAGPVDAVVLMLGTNDCKSAFAASPAEIAKGMEKLIGQVRDYDKTIPILVMSPIHLGENVWKEGYDLEFSKESVEKSKALKNEYQKIAWKNNCYFLAASDYAKPSKIDEEHMDESSHKKLADVIYGELTTILRTQEMLECI